MRERLPRPHLESKCIVDLAAGCGWVLHLDDGCRTGGGCYGQLCIATQERIQDHAGDRPATQDSFGVDGGQSRERSVAVFHKAVRRLVRSRRLTTYLEDRTPQIEALD